MSSPSPQQARTRRHFLTRTAFALAMSILPALSTTLAYAAQNNPQTILIVGDSLSAEYGLQRGTGWVTLMQNRLQQTHPQISVINASISGDTLAGGRARLAAALEQHKPTLVIIELGGNDALRGLSLPTSQTHLQAMVSMSQQTGAHVLLLGVQIPPNYGRAYAEKFAQMFAQIAQKNNTALVPFLLKGIADVPESEKYFQRDRTHPNESAQPLILENVWPEIEKWLP